LALDIRNDDTGILSLVGIIVSTIVG